MQTSPPNQHGFLGHLILIVFALAIIALGVYAYGLNHLIVNKFEARRWDIPARVYSRPLVIYEGMSLSDGELDKWLSLLHYSQSGQTTGTYQKDGNRYIINTRGFNYGDGDNDSAKTLQITFGKNTVTDIKVSTQDGKDYVRLEPALIGSIYPDSNEDRQVIDICQPRQHKNERCLIKADYQPLIDALIATEDRHFYEHHGISIKGTGRALVNNLAGGSTQGGSTLTQQLIKNFYLNSERSLKRKANEAIMALLLEAQYSKETILQTYINEINLGQNGNQSINGFGIAAQFYFNKPLSELSLSQSALLVAIAKGPSYYNPRKSPERAMARRDLVLTNLLNAGKISQEDYRQAINAPLDVVDTPAIARPKFPDFLNYVRQELALRYQTKDLQSAGLRIITTMDPLAQMAADDAFTTQLAKLKGKKALQGALVSAEPSTGAVVAVVGSDGQFTGFNRATHAKRQVGSLLKPFIYLMALQSEQYNLASGVDDSEQSYPIGNQSWTPKNYSGTSHGTVALINALANSYNQAAVNTGMRFGIDTFTNYLQQLGVSTEPYPSVLLGAVELSPMQVLGMYQVLANGGEHAPLYAIESVIDESGRLLQKAHISPEQRLPAEGVYLTNYALQQVIKQGTAKAAATLGNQLAGKTGTTNDAKDAWFAGFSGNYVSVVWVGRDDNKAIGLTGGSGALPIWIAYMKQLRLQPFNPPTPQGVAWQWLELGTGRATEEWCDNAAYLPALPASVGSEMSLCQLQALAALEEPSWATDEEELVFEPITETPDTLAEPTQIEGDDSIWQDF